MSGEAIRKAEASILFKVEATEGVDAVPTGANALRVTDYELTPLAGDVIKRGYLQPKGGAPEETRSRKHRALKFTVELGGSGAAGTPPGFAPVLLTGGMVETVDDGVSVSYAPSLSNQKTGTIYTNVSGKLRKMLGAKGDLTLSLKNGEVPKISWSGVGAWSAVTTSPQPAVAYADITKGVHLSKTNTPAATLDAHPLILEKLDINFGTKAKWNDKPNYAAADIPNREITGDVQFRWAGDWDPEALEGQVVPLALRHGIVAGNIVEISGGQVQFMDPKVTVNEEIWDCSARLIFLPDASGDNDIVITFK
jgi:hypothetical protein